MAAMLDLEREDLKKFIESFDNFIFDIDGVFWVHSTPVPGSVDVLNGLRKLGKKVFFVTNNNTKSREKNLEKLARFGIQAIKTELYPSSYVAAFYVKNILKCDKKVYMIGGKGLSEELNEVGIPNIGYGPDHTSEDKDLQYEEEFVLDPEVGTVVCGFDQFISMNKYIKATSYLVNRKCHFVATNMDEIFPMPSDKDFSIPGTGCVVAFLAKAARQEPLVAGKPERTSFDCIVAEHGIDPSRTLMTGDSLNTDILYGNRCGTKTLLVLTGASNLGDVERARKSTNVNDHQLVPDFYLPSLGHLLPGIQELLNELQ